MQIIQVIWKNSFKALATIFLITYSSLSPAFDCNTSDFQVKVPLLPAYNDSDACTSGRDRNPAIEGKMYDWLADLTGSTSGWSLTGKYEVDGGTETGTLDSDNAPDSGGYFSWTFDDGELASFDDAVFLVKQASTNAEENWAAYFFDDLNYNSGRFSLDVDFTGDNYSHLRMYTHETHAVPEIDAASGGIAMAFLLGVFALMNERRKKTL